MRERHRIRGQREHFPQAKSLVKNGLFQKKILSLIITLWGGYQPWIKMKKWWFREVRWLTRVWRLVFPVRMSKKVQLWIWTQSFNHLLSTKWLESVIFPGYRIYKRDSQNNLWGVEGSSKRSPWSSSELYFTYIKYQLGSQTKTMIKI